MKVNETHSASGKTKYYQVVTNEQVEVLRTYSKRQAEFVVSRFSQGVYSYEFTLDSSKNGSFIIWASGERSRITRINQFRQFLSNIEITKETKENDTVQPSLYHTRSFDPNLERTWTCSIELGASDNQVSYQTLEGQVRYNSPFTLLSSGQNAITNHIPREVDCYEAMCGFFECLYKRYQQTGEGGERNPYFLRGIGCILAITNWYAAADLAEAERNYAEAERNYAEAERNYAETASDFRSQIEDFFS
jgi:hypothetical protein